MRIQDRKMQDRRMHDRRMWMDVPKDRRMFGRTRGSVYGVCL